jgi:hypothetical protein
MSTKRAGAPGSWLDDHSRSLLGCTVFGRVAGDDVMAMSTTAGDTAAGPPPVERLDRAAQTQGKIERFHQTLKRWLGRRPAAAHLPGLQVQLDAFRGIYKHAYSRSSHEGVPASRLS